MRFFQHHRRPFGRQALVFLILLLAGTSVAAHAIHDHSDDQPAMSDGDTAQIVRQAIEEFRRTGSDERLDEAWRQLASLPESTSYDPDMLVLAATVAQARHDFELALELIDRALQIRPRFDQAWLLRASVLLVRGDSDRARQACARLRGSPAVQIICRARVLVARGEHRRALELVSALITSPNVDRLNDDTRAWALSVAGDATVDDAAQAIDFYRCSLSLSENAQVRAALVDQLLNENRLADAEAALNVGHDALALEVRRLIVARRLGKLADTDDAIHRADARFRHWIAHEDWAHAREMARFYLDVLERPALARRIAEINFDAQKEVEDRVLLTRLETDGQ